MSKWFNVETEDIDITEDGKEMHFWLESDDDGNVYCSANIKDIEELLVKLKK
jgi:hypothetical protein